MGNVEGIAGDPHGDDQRPQRLGIVAATGEPGTGRSPVQEPRDQLQRAGLVRIGGGGGQVQELQRQPPFAEQHRRPRRPEPAAVLLGLELGAKQRQQILPPEFAYRLERAGAERGIVVFERANEKITGIDPVNGGRGDAETAEQRRGGPQTAVDGVAHLLERDPPEGGDQTPARLRNPVDHVEHTRKLGPLARLQRQHPGGEHLARFFPLQKLLDAQVPARIARNPKPSTCASTRSSQLARSFRSKCGSPTAASRCSHRNAASSAFCVTTD